MVFAKLCQLDTYVATQYTHYNRYNLLSHKMKVNKMKTASHTDCNAKKHKQLMNVRSMLSFVASLISWLHLLPRK